MPTEDAAKAIAEAFHSARRSASALAAFPGDLPGALADAYAIQDVAIRIWPDRVAGWKVAAIAPELRERLGAPRLAGPAFAANVFHAIPAAETRFPIFLGGFAAVEAEFILRLGSDIAPADAGDERALANAVAALHAGAEIASSPFAGINEFGPTSVISDFGNNAGLIVGPELSGWRDGPLDALTSRTMVNGKIVGEGSAARVAGGPLSALAFLVEALARRGRTLRAGDLVSTGMTTGIHPVQPGDRIRFEFSQGVSFEAVAEQALPAD